MGDRYFLDITCPECGFYDDAAYYAPTCGITEWECPECKHVVDLEEETGITAAEASNRAEIEAAIEAVRKEQYAKNAL